MDNSNKLGRRPDSFPKAPVVRYTAEQDAIVFPSNYSYTSIAPVAYDQGQSSSCVVHATKAVVVADSTKHGHPIDPSRIAWYGQAESQFDPPPTDSGLESGDVLRIYTEHGYIPEAEAPWPLDGVIAKLVVPDKKLWRKDEKLNAFTSVPHPSVYSIQKALFHLGPGIGGMSVSNAMVSQNTYANGLIPDPDSVAGGHEVAWFGWSSTIKLTNPETNHIYTGAFECLTSWSTAYGIKMPGAKSAGWFYLPFEYFIKYPEYVPTDYYTISVQ